MNLPCLASLSYFLFGLNVHLRHIYNACMAVKNITYKLPCTVFSIQLFPSIPMAASVSSFLSFVQCLWYLWAWPIKYALLKGNVQIFLLMFCVHYSSLYYALFRSISTILEKVIRRVYTFTLHLMVEIGQFFNRKQLSLYFCFVWNMMQRKSLIPSMQWVSFIKTGISSPPEALDSSHITFICLVKLTSYNNNKVHFNRWFA